MKPKHMVFKEKWVPTCKFFYMCPSRTLRQHFAGVQVNTPPSLKNAWGDIPARRDRRCFPIKRCRGVCSTAQFVPPRRCTHRSVEQESCTADYCGSTYTARWNKKVSRRNLFHRSGTHTHTHTARWNKKVARQILFHRGGTHNARWNLPLLLGALGAIITKPSSPSHRDWAIVTGPSSRGNRHWVFLLSFYVFECF